MRLKGTSTIEAYADAVEAQNRDLEKNADLIDELKKENVMAHETICSKENNIVLLKDAVELQNTAAELDVRHINALRTDVADRDKHIREQEGTISLLKVDLDRSRSNNIKQGRMLREANATLHKAKTVVEGLEDELSVWRQTKSKSVMHALCIIMECEENHDMWSIHTKEDCRTAMESHHIIEGLQDEVRELKSDLRASRNNNSRLRKSQQSIDDELSVVRGRLQGKGAEVLRLRGMLGTVDRELEELTVLYCARCDQLELIEDVVGTDSVFSNSLLAVERVQKIIKEE